MGVEVVEVAITLPILILVAFMTIDICNFLHLKQKANSVAYETVRTASMSDETFESATNVGEELAIARRLENIRISVQPEESRYRSRDEMPAGARIKSVVELPVRGNIPGPFFLFKSSVIRSQEYVISAR